MFSDKMKNYGFKPAGSWDSVPRSLTGFITKETEYSGTTKPGEKVELMSTKIPEHLRKQTGGVSGRPTAKSLDVAHINKSSSQTLLDSLAGMQDELSKGRTLNVISYDIETLGTAKSVNPASKIFSMTEIGISNWKMTKDLQMVKAGGQEMSVVGAISNQDLIEMRKILEDIKSGKQDPYMLDADTRRSLKDLMKYKDSSIFKKNGYIFNGVSLNSISTPEGFKLTTLDTFNPKLYAKDLEMALTNLEAFRNPGDQIARALGAHLQTADVLVGANIFDFDFPVTAEYFDSIGTEGKTTVNAIKGFTSGNQKIKGTRVPKFAIDTQVLAELANPEYVTQMAAMGFNDITKTSFMNARGGQRSADRISRLMGLIEDGQKHMAYSDTLNPPEIFNNIMKNAHLSITNNEIKINGIMMERGKNSKVGKGNRFLGVSGLSNHEKSAYHGVYKKVGDKFVDAYNEGRNFSSSGNVYKGAVYEVLSIQRNEGLIPEHKYGTWTVNLFNEDEQLYHVFNFADDAAGGGKSMVEDLFHRHLEPISSDVRTGVAKRDSMVDKAMHTHRSLFESKTTYERTKLFYQAAKDETMLHGTWAEVEAYNKEHKIFAKSTELRDFYSLRGRLAIEGKFMGDVFDTLESAFPDDNLARKQGLIQLKNVMEGRTLLPNVTAMSTPEARVNTTPWSRAVNVDGHILDMTNKNAIIKSLKNMAKGATNEQLVRAIAAIYKKGYLTSEERGIYLTMANNNTMRPSVIKELASIISKRTKMAEEVLAGTVKDNVDANQLKAAKNLASNFTAVRKSTPAAAWRPWPYRHVGNDNYVGMNAGERKDVLKYIVDEARGNSSRGISLATSSDDFVKMIKNHDAAVDRQLMFAKGAKVGRPAKAMARLEQLVGAYVDSSTGVQFIKGAEKNTINMIVFKKSLKKELENLSPAERLVHKGVVSLAIPMVDENGLLEYGRQQKVNKMFLQGGQSGLRIETGFDQIINMHMGKAERVKALINAGGNREENLIMARKSAQMGFNSVFTSLSGIGSDEIQDELKYGKTTASSLWAKRLRGNVLDVSGAAEYYTGKPWNDYTLRDGTVVKGLSMNEKQLYQMKIMGKLGEEGFDSNLLNLYSAKEPWVSLEQAVVMTTQSRWLNPFSEFSSTSSHIYTQNLNVAPLTQKVLDGVTAENKWMTSPIVTTAYADDFFRGQRPGLNVKAAYISPYDMSRLAEDRGIDFAGDVASPYDGRSVVRSDVADMLERSEPKKFVFTDPATKWKVGDVLPGGVETTVGSIVKDGIATQEFTWNKKQDGVVTDVVKNIHGQTELTVERTVPLTNGSKIISATDKSTVTIADELLQLFGDKNDIQYVIATSATRKNMMGEILRNQTALLLHELDVTVGKDSKQGIMNSVAKVYADVFDTPGFRMRGNTMIVPEQIAANGMTKGFNTATYADFAERIYAGIDQVVKEQAGIDFNSKDRMSMQFSLSDGSIITALKGIDTIGVQPMETWQGAAGFDGTLGVAKMGPKNMEMFDLMGMKDTKRVYQGLINEEVISRYGATFDTPGRRGISGKYGDIWKSLLNDDASAEDIFIRMNEIGQSPYEIKFSEFNKIKPLDVGMPNTEGRYHGTINDLYRMAHLNQEEYIRRAEGLEGEEKAAMLRKAQSVAPLEAAEGEITQDIARRAVNKGSVMLELPGDFVVGGGINNQIRLAIGEPEHIGGMVKLDPLTQASNTVFKATQEYIGGAPGKDSIDLHDALQKAIGSYEHEALRGISSSHGFVQKNALTARLPGTGYFKASAFDPFQKMAEQYVPSGVAVINEEAFSTMTKGLGEEESAALRSLATWDNVMNKESQNAFYGISARFPLTSVGSQSTVKIVVDDKMAPTVKGGNRVVKLSIGDLIRAAGDSDGDDIALYISHYKGKTADQIMGLIPQSTLQELGTNWTSTIGQREMVDEVIRREQQMSGVGYSVNDLMEKVMLNRVNLDYASNLNRVVRQGIGQASNFNTGMRRVAETLEKYSDVTGFTHEDLLTVSNLGELVEQGPTSGKQNTYDNVFERITGKKLGKAALTPEIHQQVLEEMDKRLTMGSSMIDAVLTGDQAKFVELNKISKVIDANISREELDAMAAAEKDATSKIGSRQFSTIDEYFSAIQKMNRLSGGVKGRKDSKFGTSTGYETPEELLAAFDTPVEKELTSDVRSLIGSGNIEENTLERLRRNKMLVDGALDTKSYNAQEYLAPQKDILENIAGSMSERVPSMAKGVGWGAAAFAGLMFAENLFGHEPVPQDGNQGIPTPSGAPPGATSRIVMDNTGYERMQVTLKAKDMAGFSDEQLGSLVRNEISTAMPMDVNFNMNRSSNSQDLDELWVQGVMENSLSKGFAF